MPGSAEIYAIVFAAGASRRFGRPKLLESFAGEPLVARAARLARQCCGERSVLVTGHRAAEVTRAAAGHCAIVLENPLHTEGFGTSIALAAGELGAKADALLLLLADQPLVGPGHVEKLLGAWSGAADEIVATAFRGTRGPPVLMPKAAFPALTRLTGDAGARSLMSDPRFRVTFVECDAAAFDIDTEADLDDLRRGA